MSSSAEKTQAFSYTAVAGHLFPVLRTYSLRFAAGITLIVLSTAIGLVLPILLGRTVDTVAAPDPDRAVLYQLCWLFLGLVTAKYLFDITKAYLIQSGGDKVKHDLRTLLFTRIVHLPVSYFDRNPVGRPLTRVVNDVRTLGELFGASISVIVLDVLIITGTLGAMFWLNWRLAVVVLLSFPLISVALRLFSKQLAFAYRAVRSHLSEMNAFLGENVGAVATIQRLGAQGSRMERFKGIVDKHFGAQMDSLRIYARMQPTIHTLNGVAMASLIGVGGYWAIQGEITLGIIVAFLGYNRNLFHPLRDLIEKYNLILNAKVSAERVLDILEEPVEMEYSERPEPVRLADIEIEFKDVSFRYPTRDQNALTDINLKIPRASSLAIVGSTGAGKSSLIRLLLRFYEPTRGTIFFGGKSLPEWDKAELRSQIGVIHQEINLFQGTVRENLTLGKTGFSDETLIEKCRQAQLWDSLERRGGLDMEVHEGGSDFSVGEKQLLSFARVLVFDPPMIVLDEATASVDRQNESRLMEAVRQVLEGRTSIIIAHRLSTIEACDKIVVLEHGELKESGTFDELIQRRGLFWNFHQIHAGPRP
jgi:ATP-binding cassette subfamily B protein